MQPKQLHTENIGYYFINKKNHPKILFAQAVSKNRRSIPSGTAA